MLSYKDIRLLSWETFDGAPDNIIYDRLTGTVYEVGRF